MPAPDVEYPRSGETAQLDDRIVRALRKLLPEWARGSTLLGPLVMTAATTVAVPHRLGRQHRGWLTARLVCDTDGAGVTEITPSHADYQANLAVTHLQLRCDAAATLWVVAF